MTFEKRYILAHGRLMSTPSQTVMWHVLKRNRFVSFGIPFLLFIVVGSFGLSEITAIRVKKRDEKNRLLTAEETLKYQKKVDKVHVGEEFVQIQKKIDIDSWENKRGPRPWETPPTTTQDSKQ